MRPVAPGGFTPPAPPVQNPEVGRVFPAVEPDGSVPGGTRNSRQIIFPGPVGTVFEHTAAVAGATGSSGQFAIAHYDQTLFVIDTDGDQFNVASVMLDGYNAAWAAGDAFSFMATRFQAPELLVAAGTIADYTWPWRTTHAMLPDPSVPGSPPQHCLVIERLYPTGWEADAADRARHRANPILGCAYYGRDSVVTSQHPAGQIYDYDSGGDGAAHMPIVGQDLLLNITSYFYPGEEGTSILPARWGLNRAVMPLGQETHRYHQLVPFVIIGPI